MPKSWGGGWTPASWQGWLIAVLASLTACVSVIVLERPAGLVVMVLVVLGALWLAEAKGRPNR